MVAGFYRAAARQCRGFGTAARRDRAVPPRPHPRGGRQGTLDGGERLLHHLVRLAGQPALLRRPEVGPPLAGLHVLGGQRHQRRHDLVLTQDGVLQRRPVDDLVHRTAVHVARVRLVPAALVGPERRGDSGAAGHGAEWLGAGVAVDDRQQDLVAAPRVGIVAGQHVLLGHRRRHALRDEQPLKRAIGLEDRLRSIAPVQPGGARDLPGLLVDAGIAGRDVERRLVGVVQRDGLRLDQRTVEIDQRRPERVRKEANPLRDTGHDHERRQHEAGQAAAERLERRRTSRHCTGGQQRNHSEHRSRPSTYAVRHRGTSSGVMSRRQWQPRCHA
jgi:hypothetical protein